MQLHKILLILIVPALLLSCKAPKETTAERQPPSAAASHKDGGSTSAETALPRTSVDSAEEATATVENTTGEAPKETVASGTVPPAPAAGTAEVRLGNLVSCSGAVSVRRGERLLPERDVDIGLELIPYDLLSTEAKSSAEVDLNSAYSGGVRLRVAERSTYWFDMSDPTEGSTKTDFRLLAGSVALKVKKLSGNDRVTVIAEDTTFGVRGTEFLVTIAPDGSVLLVCLEGKVVCNDVTLSSATAVAGEAVEKRPGGELTPIAVDIGALGNLRKEWLHDRTAEFLANPSAAIQRYLREYQTWGANFDAAITSVRSHESIWTAWNKGLSEGKTYRMAEVMKDKQAVNQALFQAAKALFFYERAHYRLLDMTARLKNPGEGLQSVPLPSELSAIQGLLAKREAGLSYLRSIFKLYSAVSDGSPLGDFFAERASAGGL